MNEAVVYFLAFEKNGSPIPQQAKPSILGNLFNHIHEYNQDKKPQKIIADLNFFNVNKVNRFLLMNYKICPIKKEKDGKEVECEEGEITFAELSDEEYIKVKDDSSKTIIEIEHQNSRLSEELQALDLICGSIFALIERNNSTYIDILTSDKFKIKGSKIVKNKK